MVIISGWRITRCEPRARPQPGLSLIVQVFFGMLLLASFTACDRAPAPVPAQENATRHSAVETGLVRLPLDEVTRSGVTVEPVGRMVFRTYRTFPGVVRPNEHALANITTLVRGRVAEVHADLG